VQKINLLKLIGNVSSWAEIESRIISLSTEIERGDAFEQFCHCFFLLDPVFQFETVYRHYEIPPSLRERLGYPGIQDIGIDGLGITTDGKLIAYQAKFRSDRNNIPTLRELSTFFTVSDRADWRITITNANGLPSAINDRTKNSRVLIDRFEQLEPDFFNRLRQYLKNLCITPPSAKTPHQTQGEAIEKALLHFKENNRGQLILPCGTGKTLVAMWITERLGGNRILVIVPSLSLMSQSLREWSANTSLKPFRYLCLCSDTTVDLGKDAPVEHLYEMDIPVTTDAEIVSDFLKKDSAVASVLLSTYQSSKVLSEAVKNAGIYFDTAIFDEAHRTTGSDVGVWNIALNDKNVPVNRRIFMTATPRIYAPHISQKAKEKDILLYSMDDYEIYGKPFYEMTFGEAIDKNLITDYKVVIIYVTDREVREIIQKGGRVITDENHELDAKTFAKQVAIAKAIDAYNLKKVFTFHRSVPGAKAFTDKNTPQGINNVLKILESKNENKITLFHVNGTMSSGFRNSVMKEFRESNIGIMSNARCLIEGVDVPAVDTVAFIDPKKSVVDIVQATGRSLRKAEWKEKGYIFIPVVVDEEAQPEDLIKSSDFDTVWEVLQAMMDQDQRLQAIISQLRTMQGEGKAESKDWNNTMSEYKEKVDLYNIPMKISQSRFTEQLYAKTIEMIARSWDFWYGLTLAFKNQYGTPIAPSTYKTSEGYMLGNWQYRQKKLYVNGKLDPKRIYLLEGIGFIFETLEKSFDKTFEKGFEETLIYKIMTGNPNAFKNYKTRDKFNLWDWQRKIRELYQVVGLSQYKIQRLKDIGFIFDPDQADFEIGFRETLIYNGQMHTPNAFENYKKPDGFELWAWQEKQRELYKDGRLSPDKIRKLEDIGFIFDSNEADFETGFQGTLIYKIRTVYPNCSRGHDTEEGFKLGAWQKSHIDLYNEKLLATDKIRRLEEIGFKWQTWGCDLPPNFRTLS
jgi:superfamily II DNA or RNA helicase